MKTITLKRARQLWADGSHAAREELSLSEVMVQHRVGEKSRPMIAEAWVQKVGDHGSR